jgi:hypothetical protein
MATIYSSLIAVFVPLSSLRFRGANRAVGIGPLHRILVDDPADHAVPLGVSRAQVERETHASQEDADDDPGYELEEDRLGGITGGGGRV